MRGQAEAEVRRREGETSEERHGGAELSCATARKHTKQKTLIKTLVNEGTGDVRPESLVLTDLLSS